MNLTGPSPNGETGAPQLCPFPKGSEKRLVDAGLLQYESSVAGFSERYRRGETPQTLHVWWARRPHRSMRALLFACLSRSTGADALQRMRDLSVGASVPPLLLKEARRCLAESYGRPPMVLDMFGGGGTIPFEATVLGANMHSLDSNELAVFVQKTILRYSQALPNGKLVRLVEQSGRHALEELKRRTAPFFPLRGKVFGYFWTYWLACRQCGYLFLLAKRPWLSRKAEKRIALVVTDGDCRQLLDIKEVDESYKMPGSWVGRNGTAACPKCGERHQSISTQEAADELVAMVGSAETRGKVFYPASDAAIPDLQTLVAARDELLTVLGEELPSSRPPRWSGIVNPSLYGMETHADIFHVRQQIVLLTLIQCLREEYGRLAQSESSEAAKAVIALLSGLLDQLVDWNCRLSMWIPQNEQVGRAFCGPGVAMLWDYCETDPVERGPANLWSKLARIVAGTKALEQMGGPAEVRHGYAQDLPYPDDFFDAIVTDPPYYDNVFYNVLADYFYSWKRLLLRNLDPDLFAHGQTDSTRELVASSFRSGEAEKAHEDYCREFSRAIAEAARCLKPHGVFALLYSHSSLQGWEAVVRAYRSTGLRITSVQPLSIERKQRPRAMTSEAVNTCVVLVAHRFTAERKATNLAALCEQVGQYGKQLGGSLAEAGWHEEDIGLAVFAQAIGLLANAREVRGCEGDREALRRLGDVVSSQYPKFKVVARKSL